MRGDERHDPRVEGDSLERPPHARGRGLAEEQLFGSIQTTPACAGTRRSGPATCARTRNDPRMRGDELAETMRVILTGERPPHARGRALLTCGALACGHGFASFRVATAYRLSRAWVGLRRLSVLVGTVVRRLGIHWPGQIVRENVWGGYVRTQ